MRVIRTTEQMQTTVMNVPPGGEIEKETHYGTTQMFIVVEGNATLITNEGPGRSDMVRFYNRGDLMVIPQDTEHHVISGIYNKDNVDEFDERLYSDLKLISFYAPPVHPDKEVIQGYPGKFVVPHMQRSIEPASKTSSYVYEKLTPRKWM